MNIKRFIFIFLQIAQFISTQNAYAQNIDWVLHTNANTEEAITDKAIDSVGNIYAIGIFNSNLSFNNDTNRVTNIFSSTFITKVDANGRMIWIKEFFVCSFNKIVFINNNLVVYGSTRGTFTTNAGSIIGTNSNTRGFLITFDLNGQINSLKNLGIVNNFTVRKLKCDLANNLYLTGNIANNVVIDGTNINRNVGSLSDGVLLKFNLNLNLINFIKFSNSLVVDVAFDISGNQYITGILSGASNIGPYFLTNDKNDIFYAKINLANQVIWAYKIGGAEIDQSSSITLIKNKIYVSGYGYNLINFNGRNYNTPTNNQYNGFISIMDTSGQVLMVRFFESPNSSIEEVTINPLNEILLIGTYSTSLRFDNKQISWPISNCLFVAKLDEDLNCLWLLSLNSAGSISGVLSNNVKEYYFSGSVYSNFILFGDYYSAVYQLSNNGFLAKISDISITQSALPKRHYCGGDSIAMPFVKTGRFKNGNRFMLQLSNPQGLFDTLVQTIGFINDTTSGIIPAKIPGALTASSQYRFRIVADSPAVTSFYDTIVYAINPKPIAKTINDTVACNGQQMLAGLHLSNAISYFWQPTLLVSDSNTKQPFINTNLPGGNYQIKLTAANGFCMAEDSFMVSIKPPLRIKLPNFLTFCTGDSILIAPAITGGDSNSYNINWLTFGLPNHVIDSGLVFTSVANTNFKLVATVSDGCSLIAADSVNVLTDSYKPLPINDTLICNGKPFTWQPKVDTLFNRFVWLDNHFNLLTDTNANLHLPYADSSTSFYIINKHFCKNTVDTFIAELKVLPPLNIQITADSFYCKHQNATIAINAWGGLSQQYNLHLNNNFLDSANSFKLDSLGMFYGYFFNFKPITDSLLIFTLTDGCSANSVSDSVKIKTYLPVNINQFPPEQLQICNGLPLTLKPTINGGKLPLQFSWTNNNEPNKVISTLDSLAIEQAILATYKLRVVDNCQMVDSTVFPIQPKTMPNAVFFVSSNTICQAQPLIPENATTVTPAQDVTYIWKWHNNTSSLFEPKIQFNDTGLFYITLIATTLSGCSDTFTVPQPILVRPKPIANFYANKQTATLQQAQFEFTNTSLMQGNGQWQWDFGNNTFSQQKNPTVQYLQSGLYNIKLIATNSWQCSDTLIKPNYILVESGLTIYMPNAISVNNDGLNDSFKPVGADIKYWQMEVYNRWGIKVFECNSNTQPFNGYDMQNNPLPIDTYFYRLQVTANNNTTQTINGNVTLIR